MGYTTGTFDTEPPELRHLPLRKRREPAFICQAARDGFARATRHKSRQELREGKILKLILFGSYACGGRVAEPEHWYKTEEFLLKEELEGRLKAPVGLIVHSYQDMNSQ